MANGRDFSRPPPSLWILLSVHRTGSPLRRLAGDRRLDRRFLCGQPAVCQSTKDAADQRRHPEHPQLLKRLPPWINAGPVLRAGLTLVLVIGMLIRWISVSPRPMA